MLNQQFKKILLWLIAIVTFVLAVIYLSGCKPSEQLQRKRANDFFNSHPAEIAKRCADQFPPVIKEGKTILKTDTLIQPGISIPCPPNEKGDTIFVKCPPSRIIRDTILRIDTIENIARIYALQHESDSLTTESIKDKETIKQAKEEAKKSRNKLNHLLAGIIGAMGLIVIGIMIKNRLT